MIDFHSHILPHRDDGPQDWEDSLEMARIAVEDSITAMVCTPHFSHVYPENTRSVVMAAVDQFRARLKKAAIPLKVYPGSETTIDSELSEKIEADEVMTVNDNHGVALVEMPMDVIPPNIDRFFWKLQSAGVEIVLAHPERNLYVMKDPSLLLKWVQAGIMTQITASAISGRMGTRIGNFCISLLKRRMVHLVASDCHGSTRRRPVLSGARSVVESIVGKDEAHKIFYENPEELLLGNVPDFPSPIQSPKKNAFLRRIFTRH